MFELLLCSTLTVLPDYLYRRYVQGKRIGHEITLFSVWYELRWGITLCLILTVSLFGLACQEGMRFAERRIIPWHHGSAA